MIVYLAGPVAKCSYEEAVNWRHDAEEILSPNGWTVLNPMRGKDFLKGQPALSPLCEPDYPLSAPHAVLSRDANDVARCDVVLANLIGAEEVSIGTMMELAWAWWLRKYIVVAMSPINPHQHGFVRECASIITGSLEDAFYYVHQFAPR